jgi:hypothetical protein
MLARRDRVKSISRVATKILSPSLMTTSKLHSSEKGKINDLEASFIPQHLLEMMSSLIILWPSKQRTKKRRKTYPSLNQLLKTSSNRSMNRSKRIISFHLQDKINLETVIELK